MLITLILLSVSLHYDSFSTKIPATLFLGIDVENSATKFMRCSIISGRDTTQVFSLQKLDYGTATYHFWVTIIDSAVIVVNYGSKKNTKCYISQAIQYNGKEKKTAFYIVFRRTEQGKERIEKINVEKCYPIHKVELIADFPKKIGERPKFLVVNHSDSILSGANPIHYFFGTIEKKTPAGWQRFESSICLSTIPYKLLSKNDTAISWVPNFRGGSSEDFVFKEKGLYRYTIPIQTEHNLIFSNAPNGEKVETRETTEVFYLAESEFEID